MDQKKIPKSLRKKNGAPDGKKIPVVWNDYAIEQFEKLKKILCSELVLALPDFTKDMMVTTDASELGYRGQLEQHFKTHEQDPDEIRPIEYFSKNYTTTQKNYSTTEKEMLAVVMTVENFHPYLYGKKFKIFTDHLPLTSTENSVTATQPRAYRKDLNNPRWKKKQTKKSNKRKLSESNTSSEEVESSEDRDIDQQTQHGNSADDKASETTTNEEIHTNSESSEPYPRMEKKKLIKVL